MDAPRFDAMTKDWTRLPRRRVLGGLVAGALGPLLGVRGREARAISTTCQRSSECGAGQACVHHTCTLTCTDPFFCLKGGTSDGGTGCPSGAFCAKKPGGGGVCVQGGGPCVADVRCRKQRNCRPGSICGSGCCGGDLPKFTCQLPSVG
jgi:hypothetical protein